MKDYRAALRGYRVACTNGNPDFPDRDATGTFHLVNINTQAPAFTTAVQKCEINGMPLNSAAQGSGPQ